MRYRRLHAFVATPLLVLVAALGLTSCGSKESSGDVVAKVNGKKILRADMEKYFRNQTSGSPQQPTGAQATSLRLSILRELIDNEIMMQRAQKLGLLATDEEVNAKLTEIKAPYTQEEFDKRLKERNITLEDFKLDLRRSLTVQKVLNREITSKITISDADIADYYNQHKAEFNLIEPQYHLAQIVVTTRPNQQVSNLKNDKAQNEAEARKKVQTLLNRLESGEDFATVAMNYSEDPSTAGNGGDMGFIPESAVRGDPVAREMLARLKPGQLSGAIPIGEPSGQVAGFRIIKLLARETAGQRDLNDPRVQQAVREQLRGRREQLLKAAYYEVVRNEASVQNYLAEQILKNAG